LRWENKKRPSNPKITEALISQPTAQKQQWQQQISI
jgi:hypothetical protein